MVFKKAVWASIAAFVLFVGSASAQTPLGTISGRVLDATGLVAARCHRHAPGSRHHPDLHDRWRGTLPLPRAGAGHLQGDLVAPGLRDPRARERRAGPRQDGRPAGDDADQRHEGDDHRRRAVADGRRRQHTGTATNFTADELANIPTSRDPFSLMRSVPGVLVDRVNIGGNETGQQSNFAIEGHAAAGRGLDARRRRDHRHDADRVVADLLQLRQLRRDPRHDRRPGDHAADRRRRAQLRRQARHQHVPRRRARLLRQRSRWSGRTCRRNWRRLASRRRRRTTTSRSPTSAATSADRCCATRRGSTAPTRCRTCSWCAAPAAWSIARS